MSEEGLVPEVTRIRLPHSSELGVNSYILHLVRPVLVDTGYGDPESRDVLSKALMNKGISPSDLDALVITHGHPDHFGGAFHIVQASGVEVIAHESEVPSLTDPGLIVKRWTSAWADLGLSWRPRDSERIRDSMNPLEVDRPIRADGEIQVGGGTVRVIHGPGHSFGLLCVFLSDSRTLIASDHIMGRGSTYVGRPDGSLLTYLATCRRLEKLEPNLILPGHGEPIHSAIESVRAAWNHQIRRCAQIMDLLGHGPMSVSEIVERTYGMPPSERASGVAMATTERLDTLARLGILSVSGRGLKAEVSRLEILQRKDLEARFMEEIQDLECGREDRPGS